MWIALGVIALAWWLGTKHALGGVAPSIPGILLQQGATYAFTAQSNVDLPTFVQAMAETGAVTTDAQALIPIQGLASGYAGTFVWHGPQNDTVNDVPDIHWLTVTLMSPVTVSGVMYGDTQYGAVEHTGLELAGLDNMREEYGQMAYQVFPHEAASTMSRSQPLPFEHQMPPQHAALQQAPSAVQHVATMPHVTMPEPLYNRAQVMRSVLRR